jgi:sucrose-6F-phosphate phosphohydrolase
MTHFASNSLLVFSTGRSPELFQHLASETPLLIPDILVCSVGTEILLNGVSDPEWEAFLDQGWDRDTAAAVGSRFPEIVLQQQSEQRPHKISYKLYAADTAQATGVVSNLRSQLAAAGLDTNVVFSGGEDLDILPARASKGKALSFLLEQVEMQVGARPTKGVLACGDSGNDQELFEVPGVYGCMVANAHPELVEWTAANGHDRIFAASRDGPGGILEALYHFNFFLNPVSSDSGDSDNNSSSIGRRKEVVDLHKWFENYFTTEPARLFSKVEEGTASTGGVIGGDDTNTSEASLELGLERFEANLSPDFELIGPGGVLTSREELLTWMKQKGRGSRMASVAGRNAASAEDPLAATTTAVSAAGDATTAAGIVRSNSNAGNEVQGLLSAAMAASAAANVDTPTTPTNGGGSNVLGGGDNYLSSPAEFGRFRIWIDSFKERKLAPGVWLVRYKEIQQRFPAASATSTGRTTRWSTAILRQVNEEEESGLEGRYVWESVHETFTSGSSIPGDQF